MRVAGARVRDLLVEGPWQHGHLSANGARFHLATGLGGTADRPLVLLLHGSLQFWWAWRHQLPALDAAGYAVVAMDLRGHGASDKTPAGYDLRTAASDVAGVVAALGRRSAVVVGHDWGGLAGWATAAYDPERVTALATVAAAHPLVRPVGAALAGLAASQLPLLAERRLTAHEGAAVERLLRARAAPGSDCLTPEDARRYREALLAWPSARCALAPARALVRQQWRQAGRDQRQALRRRLTVPLLSVHGELDPLLPRSAVAAGARYTGDRHELVGLPGVGHLPPEEDPAAVTALLLRWLPTVTGTR